MENKIDIWYFYATQQPTLWRPAVVELFPDTKVANKGPSIEDGFYYDFDRAEPFIPEDLVKIEQKNEEIIKADYPFISKAN